MAGLVEADGEDLPGTGHRRGEGGLVNITSLAGVRPVGSSIPYAVSKAALIHLTVPRERRGSRDRVHAIAPGLIDTPWTADWHALRARIEDTAPLRRSGKPHDVADVCVGLIGASYATGQVLVVDGGVALR